MTKDNVTAHPDKDKSSPKEAAFKKIKEEKKNGLNSKIKKSVEEYIAAQKVADAKRDEVVQLEEEMQTLDKEKLDF